MSANTLFDIDPTPPSKPKHRCKHCVHLFEHEYNKSMKYCDQRPDPRTSYKKARIKANDPACPMFKAIVYIQSL